MAWELGEGAWETPAVGGSCLSTSMVVAKMLEGYPTFGGLVAFIALTHTGTCAF